MMAKKEELLVYSEKVTNRHRYAFKILLEVLLGCNVRFETDEGAFRLDGNKLKINYSHGEIEGTIRVRPTKLLQERRVLEQHVKCGLWNNTVTLFPTDNPVLPFDPFAATFFLVTRYEEYLPHRTDQFHRYDPAQSIAVKENFIHRPIVHDYARLLAGVIEETFGTKLQLPSYKMEFSVDVDTAFAYLNKGSFRTALGVGKSMLAGNFKDVAKRVSVLTGERHDPFDTFDYLLELQKRLHILPIYFFLMGDIGVYDKSTPSYKPAFQALVRKLSDYSSIGIHPSYASNEEREMLDKEYARLGEIIHGNVTKSRQHYLFIDFPSTYKRLRHLGISDDYSMAYASVPGFRASIGVPYPFYNLDTEEMLPLHIHPFCIMDVTYQRYLKLEPHTALREMLKMVETCRETGAVCHITWHNDSLCEEGNWTGWRTVLENLLQKAVA